MSSVLLDYVFPVTVVTPTPPANASYLKRVAVAVKPKDEMVASLAPVKIWVASASAATPYVTATALAEITQLFNAGMNRVCILIINGPGDLADIIPADPFVTTGLMSDQGAFFTILFSSEWSDSEVLVGPGTPAQPATPATLEYQDITISTIATGLAANNTVSITIVDGNEAGEAVVTFLGEDQWQIEVELDVTTEGTIVDAINNHMVLSGLVLAESTETEAVADNALSPTYLLGALDEVPEVPGDSPLATGTWNGVLGVSSLDDAWLTARINDATRIWSGFIRSAESAGRNLFFAFGKLLSNVTDWTNLQYIPMPVTDSITELANAESYFEDRISFVLTDEQYSHRLAFFSASNQAITAPYIVENLKLLMQSRTLQWIADNTPDYTLTEAALLEVRLQEDVINVLITRGWLSGGTVEITLEEDNFVASGAISIPEPKALWRVRSTLRQT